MTYIRGHPLLKGLFPGHSLTFTTTLHCWVLDKQLRFWRRQVCVPKCFLPGGQGLAIFGCVSMNCVTRPIVEVNDAGRDSNPDPCSRYRNLTRIVWSKLIFNWHFVREEIEREPQRTSLKTSVKCWDATNCCMQVCLSVWG